MQVFDVLFSTLVNCSTLRELVRRAGLLKVLYCSEMESPTLKGAYNSIVDYINSSKLIPQKTLPAAG